MMYRVSFEIDVEDVNPERACNQAWELLSGEGSFRPIGTVAELDYRGNPDEGQETKVVDLQELEE